MKMPNIYAPNKDAIANYYKIDYRISKPSECKVYENVLLESLKKSNRGPGNTYLGGICYENGEFIAGFYRDEKNPIANRSIYDSYKPGNEEIVHLEGEYIFGGVFMFEAFAHFCTDDMTRLWYIAKNLDKIDPKCKIFFFAEFNKFPTLTIEKLFYSVMDLLGIEKNRVFIVDKIFKADKVYVPDQSFSFHGGYTDEYLTAYRVLGEKAMERAPEGKVYSKKVFLTRVQYAKNDCINEQYFVDVLKKQGYEPFSPETVPFDEQIRVLYNAEDVCSIFGSATYLKNFSINLKSFTLMLRDGVSEYFFNRGMAQSFQAMDAELNIVDISMNCLPTTHTGGIFMVGPTSYWKQYMDARHFSYDQKDLEFDWSLFPTYANKYVESYVYAEDAKARLSFVKNYDMYDVLNRLNLIINDSTITRAQLDIKSKTDYEKEIKALSDKIDILGKKESELTCHNKNLAERAAKNGYYSIPADLRMITPARKNVKILKLQCGKSLYVNGTECNTSRFVSKANKSFAAVTSDWEIFGLVYAYMFEKKYDLIFYMPEQCDILFSNDDLNRLCHSAIDIVFDNISLMDKSISQIYTETYGASEWNRVIDTAAKYLPEYSDKIQSIVNDNILLSGNKFIMRKHSFNKFAEWAITVLNEIVTQSENPKAINLPEVMTVLITIYFKVRDESVIALLNGS